MAGTKKKEWALLHRPVTLENYVFPSEEVKRRVTEFIADQSIPHLFFYGPPGTGKTTLAELLRIHLNIDPMDYLEIDGSLENSVETVRNKIEDFAKLAPVSESGFKLVFIDECDYLSHNAQGTLRKMMEQRADNVSFILSCNYPHKIIPPLKSRIESFEFKALDKGEMCVRVLDIMKEHGITCDTEEEFDIIENILNSTYPDFRKFISTVQSRIKDGKLIEKAISEDQSLSEKIELLESVGKTNINWETVRNSIAGNISDDEFLEYYRFFYEYIDGVEKFKDTNKWKIAMVLIADYMYKHSIVADKEINFLALLIKLHGA